MSDQDAERRRSLVEGRGAYIADLLPAGTLHAGFVRSHLPHAEITSVELDEAREVDGCVDAFSGADLAADIAPLRIEGPGLSAHDWHPLPTDRARFVGEALAVVLAEDPYAAEDAADAVFVDLDPLPPVVTLAQALADDAPLLHEGVGGNVLFEWVRAGGDAETAFATAEVVVERTIRCARQTPLPLEPRGVLAQVEATTGTLLVWTSTQIPHIVRTAVAQSLGRSEASVRIITPDVGGGFGLKANVFAEEIVVAALAVRTGRPVRWIEDRRENLTASAHARAQEMHVRVAATRAGRILATDIDVLVDVGAHSSYPFSASLEPVTTSGTILSCYDIPNVAVRARGLATNKCPVGPYRGVGAPPAAFATERVLDVLADELGMDRAELRLANLIPPTAMPYLTPTGVHFDSGDYPGALHEVLDRADYPELCRQQDAARGSSTIMGIGLTVFNEHSGPGSTAYRRRGVSTIPGFDSARVEMDHRGRVTVYVSSADAGQDHVQSYRLATARALGIPVSLIEVVEGDTASCPPGSGTFASRSGTAQLSAVVRAAQALRQRLLEVAALSLGTPVDQVRETEGGFEALDGSARLSIEDVARRAHLRVGDFMAPDGFSPGLEATATFDPIPTYPYGAHVSVVELDVETLQVRLLRHVGFEDCGVIVNEAAVHEQIVGGIAMGIGNVLFEEHVYDEEGQIRTASLLDYLVPLATDMPVLELSHGEIPTDRTPLGSKGVAEAGTIGAVAAIGAAVSDALRQLGAEANDLPVSPTRLYAAVALAQASATGPTATPSPAAPRHQEQP